ncbi:MAG TPA: hypothetical protein VJP60_01055 [Rhizomicrobium sp.]|nr:hypothetical protein [Rhizomicrobium sp.]
MDADAIRAVDARARSRFLYRAESIDNWRSHADAVLKGEAWFGDCDDLASTTLDLLGRDGVAADDRYRLVVSSTGAKKPDHMVACVRADDGAFLIVGDTFKPAYAAAAMRHRGIFYNRLNETQPEAVWREGVPWRKSA